MKHAPTRPVTLSRAAFFSALMMVLVLQVTIAAAQEPEQDAVDAEVSEQQEEGNDDPAGQADNAQRPADLDSEPLETPAGQAPGRFIPSEQISLDLGVSFPVDI